SVPRMFAWSPSFASWPASGRPRHRSGRKMGAAKRVARVRFAVLGSGQALSTALVIRAREVIAEMPGAGKAEPLPARLTNGTPPCFPAVAPLVTVASLASAGAIVQPGSLSIPPRAGWEPEPKAASDIVDAEARF